VTDLAIEELFRLGGAVMFRMSFFEIYGGQCFDLLNGHKRVSILEDGNNNVRSF
jgi:hypothetical protein